MVASNDPRPVTYRLDQFERPARESSATEPQRASVSAIAATRTTLARNPDDPAIVTDLTTLFGLFDDPVRPVEANYQPQTGTISGDPTGTTVGKGMRIHGLNARWIQGHPGSEPQSGAQRRLMDLLESDPGQRSTDKYIKGHVLNHNPGGIGDERNMYPITGNANSRHYYAIERQLVNWVTGTGNQNNWAIYEVDVVGESADLRAGRPVQENKVDATLQCRAVLKDQSGRDRETILATITPNYRQRQASERFMVGGRA